MKMTTMTVADTAPYGEVAIQAGVDNYDDLADVQGLAFIDQIHRYYGTPPRGCKLFVEHQSHDLGTYATIDFLHESANPAHIDYALAIEADDLGRLEYWR